MWGKPEWLIRQLLASVQIPIDKRYCKSLQPINESFILVIPKSVLQLSFFPIPPGFAVSLALSMTQLPGINLLTSVEARAH